jgi:FMN phosphatase YigB (HAD superfamily)
LKIGFDFDRVLFDTDTFNKYLKENVEGLKHVDASPYNENEVYSPEIHAELCGIPVERIYGAIEDTSQFLYPDVEALKDIDHEVVIISRGEKEFQKAKIENSGILSHVDDFYVIEKGAKDQVDIDILVDDTLSETERVSIPSILFKREEEGLEDAVNKVNELATRESV